MSWDECCIAKLSEADTVQSSSVIDRFPWTYAAAWCENKRGAAKPVRWARDSVGQVHKLPESWLRPEAVTAFGPVSQWLSGHHEVPAAWHWSHYSHCNCKDCNAEIKESTMSFVLVQFKNRKEKDGCYPLTATALLTQNAAGIELDENLPYLSLYMSFGSHLGPENK